MGTKFFLCLALVGSCGLMAPDLWAQSLPGDTISGKTHRIDDVNVTARRRPARITSTVPVQWLTGEEMEALGVQDMADAVRRFSGANVKDYGGLGGLKTVSVRNMGAAHTAVSYDGVAVSNCLGGQVDIGRFSINNVEMLSLSIGQPEEMLQSARLYASAGVLSIETEKPHFREDRSSAWRARLQAGSFGYLTPSLRYWQQLGGHTKLSVEGSILRGDGNYPFTLTNGKQQTREKRNNSAICSYQTEANLYRSLTHGGELSLKTYYYHSKRGLPGAVTLYNPTSKEKLWDETFFAQTQYLSPLGEKWSLKAQAKYTYGWNRTRDFGTQYADGVYEERFRQEELYGSVALLYRPLQGLFISLAQDGIYNHMTASIKECPFPTRYSSLTALHGRYEWNRLRIDGSLVHTATWEQVKEGDAPDNFHRLAPSIALNFKLLNSEDLFLRVMYKSTFRLPTFNDLYYFRLGNHNLKPEKADEFNVGITWSRTSLGPWKNLTLTVDGYFNQVTDKIVAFPGTFVWKMANFGKVHASGIDASMAATLPLGHRVQCILSGAYMWQKAIDLTDPTAKNYKNQLPYTPQHSGNASLLLETPWLNMAYSAVAVGERYFMAQNLRENRIDGYVEQSITLSRSFCLRGGSTCTLRAECINLADTQYDVVKYYPMPGRSWRCSIEWKF